MIEQAKPGAKWRATCYEHDDGRRQAHVVPIDDLREHEDTPTCWCKPTPCEDEVVYTHHSLDQREKSELQ
jgi:hypothetical protein